MNIRFIYSWYSRLEGSLNIVKRMLFISGISMLFFTGCASSSQIYVLDGAQIIQSDNFSISPKRILPFKNSQGEIENLTALFVDEVHHIYVAENTREVSQIIRFDGIDGSNPKSFGTLGNDRGQFNYPRGIFIDHEGKIYIADTGNHRIISMDDMNGTNWTSFGSKGDGINQFDTPMAIAVDTDHHIYIADTGNNRIVSMDDMNGTNWTSFGSKGDGINQFKSVSGLSLDSKNRIYTADATNGRIVRFRNMKGDSWTSFRAYEGPTSLVRPIGIFISPLDKIYFYNQSKLYKMNSLEQGSFESVGGSYPGDSTSPFEWPISQVVVR